MFNDHIHKIESKLLLLLLFINVHKYSQDISSVGDPRELSHDNEGTL